MLRLVNCVGPSRSCAVRAVPLARRFHVASSSGASSSAEDVSKRKRESRKPVEGTKQQPTADEDLTTAFPFSNLSERQFQQWSDEIREHELPLQAFFARHRPLLLMDPDIKSTRQQAEEVRNVQVWTPSTNLFEAMVNSNGARSNGNTEVVSARIARELGPFDAESETVSLNGDSTKTPTNKVTGCTVLNLKDADRENSETTTVIFARTTNDESPLQAVISFLNDNVPDSYSSSTVVHEDFADEHGISATSVKRKRKLKMNRHKYRKRMKAQRSLRKRLGK
jgi:hypothetical protein